MKKQILCLFAVQQLLLCSVYSQSKKLISIPERVNVQADSAKKNEIIDKEWVAVGINKSYALQYDYTLPFNGKPSYRFELKAGDNSLSGYAEGETKGRVEMSYSYATANDFKKLPASVYENAQKLKTVYHYGKGICEQGSSRSYTFSVYIPSSMPDSASTIFAQWHGTPSRTLVSTPEGEIKLLTIDQFLALYDRMIFKKNIAHDKVEKKGKNGEITYMAGKPNGWLIEQGGYPPLAFGFSKGYFYIKANSDRQWLTDKTDRNNAGMENTEVMRPLSSKYKTSTIAYRMPFNEFPKDCWITFVTHIDWTKYGKEENTILKPGKLDVTMSYLKGNKQQKLHIVNQEEILIGRNDEDGYYFKFGIYRVGNSTVPVAYNLGGYSETVR
ncbi:heparin lyase [Pedobacter sp. ok626]|uniref:heparin lyase I family protein n=1 Tax=Pedobacter sp. ok626 TaxID=1761882 RepID=UPI00087F0DB4|nr:heparin lyase I family protein [Pedobacter sp. ok626]SDK16261.1 heparin lyase [Pedobacter sp. ok626]